MSCKDTTIIPKLYVLENFSRVNKCQSADSQLLTKQNGKLCPIIFFQKFPITVNYYTNQKRPSVSHSARYSMQNILLPKNFQITTVYFWSFEENRLSLQKKIR